MSELEQLFEHMKECSRDVFRKHGQCLPTFVTLDPPLILPGIWQSNAEKRMMVAMVKALFKQVGVARYGFAFEAWVAEELKSDDRIIDFENMVLPSERPDRREAIMIIAEEKNSKPLAGMWIIERDKRGRGKITRFEIADANSHQAVGVFRDMLGTEVLH